MTHPHSTRVIVGLSGGVDSSVSALRLKQQGYQVEGLFMKNWEEDDTDTYCSAAVDVADARAVCEQLNIPLHTVNFAAEYWDNVFTHFLTEYKAGRTPNPDILCNKEIKFKAFLDYATTLGADFIATGHYARVISHENHWQLHKGVDLNKDQSYFLYTLGQAQLARVLFPVGDLTKPMVRKMAADAQLVTHAKKDSTGICFIGERKFKQFLSQYLPAQPGEIVTPQGRSIGRHDGLMYYTLGQRQGLGIGGDKLGTGAPWYVVKKDLEENRLIVSQDPDEPLLLTNTLMARDLHWVNAVAPEGSFTCTAKIRYRQADQACRVEAIASDCYKITFIEPQRAVTPGQSIVFYNGSVCLGGGIIQ